MEGIKISLLGVCLGILGLAAATNHIIAIGLCFVGVTVSVAALFVKK